MRRIYREYLINILFYIVLPLLCFHTALIDAEAKEKVVVEYYYYNSCDGCTEGEHFEQELKESVSDVIGEEEYTFLLKDVSKENYYEEFQELTKNQRTEDFYPQPPLLKVGDIFLYGLDDITEHSREAMIESIQGEESPGNAVESMREIDPSDTFLVYFYMPGCGDCQKVQKYLETVDKTIYIGQEESRVKTVYINIGSLEFVPLANWFYDQYNVEDIDRKAPVIFYQNGFLQGFEDIRDGLPGVLESGQARGWQDITYDGGMSETGFTLKDWGGLLVTGLANGLNPCGLSMLLLLISLLLAKKEKVLRLGITFVAAKFLTYLLLGTVFGSVIGELGALAGPAQKALKWVLAGIFILLAILNFADLVMAKREKYGKIKLQLPAKLKKFNTDYLERLVNQDTRFLNGLVFLAGIVVSAGEFLCTGQLYLASILYVMERQSTFQWSVFLKFLAYVTAMCTPLIIVVAAAARSAGVFSISELVRKRTWLIKLIYGGLFLVFAILILTV